MEGNLTPQPLPQDKPTTMSFFDALREVQKGRTITRISWANNDYCLMKDGYLSIFRNGKVHQWIVNDGDMEGNDWIIEKELN